MSDDNAETNVEIRQIPPIVFDVIYLRNLKEEKDIYLTKKVDYISSNIINEDNQNREEDFSFNEHRYSLKKSEEVVKAFEEYRLHLVNLTETSAYIECFEELVFHSNSMLDYIIENTDNYYEPEKIEKIFSHAKAIITSLINDYETDKDEDNIAYGLNQLSYLQYHRAIFYKDIDLLKKPLETIDVLKSKMLYRAIDANLEGLIYKQMAVHTSYGESFQYYEKSIQALEKALELEDAPIEEYVQNYVYTVNDYCNELGANFSKREEVQKNAKQHIHKIANKKKENSYLREFAEEIGMDFDEDYELDF